jgi:RND family efflux transporter MFP subunit
MKSVYFSFLLLSALVFASCSGGTTGADAQAAVTAGPVPVTMARAESRQIERSISVTGTIQPDETATVSNELAGTLEVIHVDFGQHVRKGQVLAELDKREMKLQLDRIRAAMAQALARIGLDPDEADVIPETTPSIRQAQAQLDNARTKYESAAKLVKTGDIASDRFVELEKSYSAAQATLDAARHELRVALASIQSLRAEVGLAEKRLDDATILAPFDGAVTERLASPGEYLRQNTPIVRLVKTYPLRLRLDIPETAAAAVQIGTGLTFTTDALPGEEFTAVVREVNPSLDARSRSLSAEARLTANDSRLRPGMFVQVRLVVERNVDIVVVPNEAIQTVAGLTKLFTIQDGKASEVRFRRGDEMNGWVEVRDAQIQAGDLVATSKLAVLTNGAAVAEDKQG